MHTIEFVVYTFLIFNNSVPPDMTLEKGHWEMKKDRPGLSTTNPTKKSQKTKPLEGEKTIGGKDASLFLFRALGKILHCKRKSYFPVFFFPLLPFCNGKTLRKFWFCVFPLDWYHYYLWLGNIYWIYSAMLTVKTFNGILFWNVRFNTMTIMLWGRKL